MTDSLPIPLSPPLTPAQQTTLVNLVRRAAKTEILPRFCSLTRAEAQTKSGPQDLVTEADRQSEAMLTRRLQQMFPHALIVGEEAVADRPDLRNDLSQAEMAVIIDPVDGTWNFVHGLPLFGVIVAVTRFGRPVLGLLYDPVCDDWIMADTATSARHVTALGVEQRIAVSHGGELSALQGYIHYDLMSRADRDRLGPLLSALGRCVALRCSCHEYRLLARGAVDFVMSDVLNPWDHAAGVLICRQAGGVARMLSGDDYTTAFTTGVLLCAATEDSWLRLRDHFSCLIAP